MKQEQKSKIRCYGCGDVRKYLGRSLFGNIMYYTGLVLGIIILLLMFLAYLSQEILIWKVK